MLSSLPPLLGASRDALTDEAGQDLVEIGVMLALTAIVVIVGFVTLGPIIGMMLGA